MFKYFNYCSLEVLTSFLLFTVVTLFYLFLWLLTKNYSYWQDRNVPYIEPSLFFGNLKEQVLRKESNTKFVDTCYKTFKANGYGGVFLLNTPVLFLCKPELIEKVLIEDFTYFHDRLAKEDGRYPLLNTLSYCTGEKWKILRSKVAPAFSSEKVRGMFEQIMCGTDRVIRKITDLSEHNEPIEVENLTTVYATEVLASCMFGVEVSDIEHYKRVEESFEAIFNPSFFRYAIMVLGLVNVKLYNKLKLQRVPKKAMDTFTKLIRDVVCYRKNEVTKRDDVLQTILDLKSHEVFENTSNDESSQYEGIITDDCISTLMYNFMTAGIKPTSVAITFALYEIARHPLVQETLNKEISEALKKHGGWSFEAVEDMGYLDRVVLETLRMYSFNLVVVRSVTKPYTLPGTDVTLEKDIMVLIPVDSLQKDKEFYPEPEEFKPDRWTTPQYRATSLYLPFGHGPRACVGGPLALLMVKLCLARVLAERQVAVAHDIPLMDDRVFYPKVKGGMWLTFSGRK